eukprot:Sspe_Gene.39757::Locus_19166_Transcript_1_1_Confidence_1.000_Length_3163::g.39757::m.39757
MPHQACMLLLVVGSVIAEPAGWPSVQPGVSGWVNSVGNHRFSIMVPEGDSKTAQVSVPWRRHDGIYSDVLVVHAETGFQAQRCALLNASNVVGEVVFEGFGAGRYHVYYLPFRTCGYDGGSCTTHAKATYPAPTACASKPWWSAPPLQAHVEGYESRSQFAGFTDMEFIAAPDEVTALLERCGTSSPVLFAEDRSRPIRMGQVPYVWTKEACKNHFTGVVQPGEVYTMQVAVLIINSAPMAITAVEITGLPGNWTCMSTQGTDYWGRPFSKHPEAKPGALLPLWLSGEIPATASGNHSGMVRVVFASESAALPVTIVIKGNVLTDRGDGDIWRGSRLAWLNSKVGTDFGTVPPPYIPITSSSNMSHMICRMLGKTITVNQQGMLQGAKVAMGGGSGAAFIANNTEALDGVTFTVSDGGVERKYTWEMATTQNTSMLVGWTSVAKRDGITEVEVNGSIDATGYADFVVHFTNPVPSKRVAFGLSVRNAVENAVLAMGLGVKGGLLKRVAGTEWKWDGVNGNNGVWVGSTRAGVRVYLKGDDDLWQAGVPYDSKASPPIPTSWSNGGKGGIRLLPNGTAQAFTGERVMGRGDSLTFRFSIMITPVRDMDLAKHFRNRYVQLSGPANYTHLASSGATVANMHQGNEVNPWINYPYLTNPLMKAEADGAHKAGMKFKVYNTMRELSNHAKEVWALRSFNETYVYSSSRGDGSDWLQEHLGKGYEVAWSAFVRPAHLPGHFPGPIEQDAAIKVQAMSRWNNYYVEGLRQMKEDFGNDGIYLDEIAYDRVTMLRARKVLGPDGLIDHHSDSGAFCTSPAMNYMELFPFIDSLWYGEGFKYESDYDYWLVEISGIPFGLNADMLRYTGMTPFPYRGMLHASANRWQCGLTGPVGSCPFDPRAVWMLWDSFAIHTATMYGYWLQIEDPAYTLPVTTSEGTVKVTSYVKKGTATLIVLASFGESVNTTLTINWGLVGLSPSARTLTAPAMKPMQPTARRYTLSDPIPVEGGSGLILILS